MEEEQKLYWGMHFCNSKMFKTVAKVEMYIQEQKAGGGTLLPHIEEHTQYYMTEQGQIFKLDKIKFDSYELDLQRMVWFQNQDFAKLYFDGNMRYTELDLFENYYDFRKERVYS